MSDEHEPEQGPDGQDDDEAGPRALGPVAAFGWGCVAWLFAMVVLEMSRSVRPGLRLDLVNNEVCVALGFSLATIAAMLVHLPELEPADALGVRPVSPLLLVVAALTGGVLQVPATWMSTAIETRFPRSQEELDLLAQLFTVPAGAYRIAFAACTVALGPLVEELLFRGVLFRGLRRGHARAAVVVTTATLFSFIHLDARKFLPILLSGLVLGHLRERAGSLGPSLVGHMTFNAITTFALLVGWSKMAEPTTPVPFAIGAGASVALVGLLALYTWLAQRSPLAAAGREADAS